ncbi:ATPase, T2SS/T4P/T4SS family [Ilumatobacter sp.]|uniref:ATPase, T2SS/T4P/T4SS family n=1 Tax=Ilumatobacter sp. TaxID=1967498 RepID=UPI003B528FE2
MTIEHVNVELEGLARQIRREFGERLPLKGRDERPEETQLREERTRLVLERDVLPEVAAQRREQRRPVLSQAEEIEVVDQIIAGLFTIPKLMGALRNPNVTDILVFGSAPVRVEELDGSVTEWPPLVSRDRDLERIIYDVSVQSGRPFNIENHEVDFELEPGVRFHAGGFDPVQRPYIAIRRAALFGASLDELYDRGAADAGIVELLRAAVASGLGMLFVGPMGSGKTTWLRATIAEIDASQVITTIESDFELNVLQMGKHPYVIAYQERLPTTIDSKGYTPAEAMRPAMRTRAHWIIVGEVRGGEGAPLVRAMQTGQGAMGTVHGGDAEDALDNLVNLIASDSGQATPDVKTQVYRAIDLVVALDGSNTEGRWVSEIVAPSVENAGERFVLHRIYGDIDSAPDQRARALNEPQATMMRQLRRHDRDFSNRWWAHPEDTYKPLDVSAG